MDRKDFNSYGSRRGNHEVMIRGTFANIRLRNQLLDDVQGGYTRDFTQDGAPAGVHLRRRAELRRRRTSRWWCSAARSTAPARRVTGRPRAPALLGVRAVIAESFERIHRSNLIGMGVHPAAVPRRASRPTSLGLDGTETFDITGIEELNDGETPQTVHVTATKDGRRRRSSSTPWSASTPPVRPTTTATAASCSTCCAT